MKRMKLSYKEDQNGYLMPEVTTRAEKQESLGRFARKRLNHLKENSRAMYQLMLVKGTLPAHLAEIEQTARNRIELMTEEGKKAQGLTEELKMRDPLKWAAMVNNLKQTAEQVVMRELVLA
jgi:hypothetical protein